MNRLLWFRLISTPASLKRSCACVWAVSCVTSVCIVTKMVEAVDGGMHQADTPLVRGSLLTSHTSKGESGHVTSQGSHAGGTRSTHREACMLPADLPHTHRQWLVDKCRSGKGAGSRAQLQQTRQGGWGRQQERPPAHPPTNHTPMPRNTNTQEASDQSQSRQHLLTQTSCLGTNLHRTPAHCWLRTQAPVAAST